jgi:hypothetical protein
VSNPADIVDVSGFESHVVRFEHTLRSKLDGYARRLQADLSRRVRSHIDESGPPAGQRSASSRIGNRTHRLSDALDPGGSGNIFERVIDDGGLRIVVGIDSKLIPYAVVHEYGAVIRPRRARALTIPVSEEAAKALSDAGGDIRALNLFVIRGDSGNAVLARKNGDGVEVLFVLTASVTVEPRPFWGPGSGDFEREDLPAFAVDFTTDAATIWNAT